MSPEEQRLLRELRTKKQAAQSIFKALERAEAAAIAAATSSGQSCKCCCNRCLVPCLHVTELTSVALQYVIAARSALDNTINSFHTAGRRKLLEAYFVRLLETLQCLRSRPGAVAAFSKRT